MREARGPLPFGAASYGMYGGGRGGGKLAPKRYCDHRTHNIKQVEAEAAMDTQADPFSDTRAQVDNFLINSFPNLRHHAKPQ